MGFFRSQKMRYCHMIVHNETAFDIMIELGYLGKLEFKFNNDRNFIKNEEYVDKVERCARLERVINRFQDELKRLNLKTFYYPNVDRDHEPKVTDLHEIEKVLLKLENELNEVIRRTISLKKIWIGLLERREVLLKTDIFLTGARNTEAQITSYDTILLNILQNSTTSKVEQRPDKTSPLSFITGAVPVKSFGKFEVMVWRVSRGNAYMRHAAIELPEEVVGPHAVNRYKYAFMLAFVGDEMYDKLSKVCHGFGVRLYPCPVLSMERQEEVASLQTDLVDIEKVYIQTLEHKQRILAAPIMDLYIWRSKIRKIKDVYAVLSQFNPMTELSDVNKKYLQAHCWVPAPDVAEVRKALLRGCRRGVEGDAKHMVFPPILNDRKDVDHLDPPTLFRTNKFTRAFQNLVDAYGVAAYRELNPTPFYIITFPFFFAIMFADMGHGFILALISVSLILFEKQYLSSQRDTTESHEVFDLLFAGRYIMLLMGVFAMYTGFIFNDVFSKTLNIFGSSWQVNFTYSDVKTHEYLQLDPARLDNFLGNPYVLGLDPIWGTIAENWVKVSNSLKMKVSVVMGIAHMIFGLFLSAANALYFRNKVELYLNFLPQLLFMCSIFLYLVILIFQKWFSFGGHEIQEFSPGCAPSLFTTFLNMLLFKEPVDMPEGCLDYIYSSQAYLQKFLVFVAILCALVLLCGYPLRHFFMYNKIKFKKKTLNLSKSRGRIGNFRTSVVANIRKSLVNFSFDIIAAKDSSSEFLGKHKLSDIWIRQAINTVECILGSISHTASYLRLWALSLAHGELSFIVWEMVFGVSFSTDYGYLNSVVTALAFLIFAIMTVVFLVVMEGLAAFLHTLRLHWFEFQSKFYKGTGHAFNPFHFKPSKKMDAEV